MTKYSIKAILPWVKLVHDDTIDMGPVRFCRASEYNEYLDSKLHQNFKAYIKRRYADISARVREKNEVKDICIMTTPLEELTCIAVDEMKVIFLSGKQKDELILDAVQFLCFLSNIGTTRNRPYDLFNNLKLFREIGRLNKDILEDKPNWGYRSWFNHPGRQAELLTVNKELLRCFGKLLLAEFLPANPRWARRVVRAIQYYNRIFIGLDYSYIEYYATLPEDVVFLSMAFESLLDVHFAAIERKNTLNKITNIIQNIFNIKYNHPRDVLSKWIQEFYNLRSRIVHGDEIPDQIFHGNINLDIPYINMGMKVFVAALICELSSRTCLEPNIIQRESDYIEDFYIYLWSQISILSTIEKVLVEIKGIAQKNGDILEKTIELTNLEEIYLSVYCDRTNNDLKIKPSNKKEFKKIASQIIHTVEQKVNYKGKELRIINLDRIKDLSKTDELIEELKASAC